MFEKIFFVLSPSFHGATLLAKFLNSHPEVTTLGDTYPSNHFDQVCGCGELVSGCPFWRVVKADTGTTRNQGRTRKMLAMYPGESGGILGRLAYSDFTSFWATPGVLKRVHGNAELAPFRADFESFLESVYRHTPQPGKIFVDGVKYISRLEALVAAGVHIDGVIHLYRDPIDFVSSSMRSTGRDDWRGIVEHSLRYRLYHARARQAARHIKNSIKLSYESLADNIDGELARLFRFLGVTPLAVTELQIFFEQEWHFMGNASLFKFDGMIRRSRYDAPPLRKGIVRLLAGDGGV